MEIEDLSAFRQRVFKEHAVFDFCYHPVWFLLFACVYMFYKEHVGWTIRQLDTTGITHLDQWILLGAGAAAVGIFTLHVLGLWPGICLVKHERRSFYPKATLYVWLATLISLVLPGSWCLGLTLLAYIVLSASGSKPLDWVPQKWEYEWVRGSWCGLFYKALILGIGVGLLFTLGARAWPLENKVLLFSWAMGILWYLGPLAYGLGISMFLGTKAFVRSEGA